MNYVNTRNPYKRLFSTGIFSVPHISCRLTAVDGVWLPLLISTQSSECIDISHKSVSGVCSDGHNRDTHFKLIDPFRNGLQKKQNNLFKNGTNSNPKAIHEIKY